jgi:hypothetical protein
VGRVIFFRRKRGREEIESRIVEIRRETRRAIDLGGREWEVALEAEAIRLTKRYLPDMPYTWPWWFIPQVELFEWAAVIPTIDGRGPWSLDEAQAVRRVMDDLRARDLKPYYNPENIEEIFSRNPRIVPSMDLIRVVGTYTHDGFHTLYRRRGGEGRFAVAIYEPLLVEYIDSVASGELDGYVSDLVGYVYGSLATLNLVPRDMGVLEALEKNQYLRAAIPIIWWMISLLGNWGFLEIK